MNTYLFRLKFLLSRVLKKAAIDSEKRNMLPHKSNKCNQLIYQMKLV